MIDKKALLVIGLEVLLACVFVAGAGMADGPARTFYQSYAADIIIPFSFYFLLTLSERRHPVLKAWWVKLLAIFALCSASEVLQFFGVFALARVFDPLDFVMYGVGVLLAAGVDRLVLARSLAFWD